MSKSVKKWLMTAASLTIVGCIIFGGVMTVLKWDFSRLGANKYETNRYEISEAYEDISITADTARITFVPSTDGKTTVTAVEHKNAKHSLSVKDGVLTLSIDDQRKWYEYIVAWQAPKITVAIPEGEYSALKIQSRTGGVSLVGDFLFESADIALSTGDVDFAASCTGDVKITTSTGDIEIENSSVGSLALSVTTGDIEASGVTCAGALSVSVSTGDAELENVRAKSFSSSGNTGDLSLDGVIIAETLSVKRSAGNVRFEGSDAGEIFVETDTGSVKGTLLSEKVFFVRTDTGKIDVPETQSGGICKITTDTGNIILSIGQKND